MKKIEISDELYSKIEEAYAEVKRNKDKIPPVVYAKYGNSFDSFVEHILNDFIESAKRTQRFQKTFNDMMKDFDVSKLQDELSSLSSSGSGGSSSRSEILKQRRKFSVVP